MVQQCEIINIISQKYHTEVIFMSRFWDHTCDITVNSHMVQQYGITYMTYELSHAEVTSMSRNWNHIYVTLQLHTDSAVIWDVLQVIIYWDHSMSRLWNHICDIAII